MANKKIIVIGSGIGGLFTAIKLAQQGYKVQIIEARNKAGGFASDITFNNFSFDSSFYILFDKPGLEWAMQQIHVNIHDITNFKLVDKVYHVLHENETEIAFHKNIEDTATILEQKFKGSASTYKSFLSHVTKIHQTLQPLSYKAHPNFMDMLFSNVLLHIPFLTGSLGNVLERSHLPQAVQKALGVWALISGQPLNNSVSTLSLIPSLMHHSGAYYPMGGIASLTNALTTIAEKLEIEITYNTKVKSICTKNKVATGITTKAGETVAADGIISNYSGIGTYSELVDDFSESEKQKLNQQPLQSVGLCVYLAVKGINPNYYLRFKVNGKKCIAFVQPGIIDPSLEKEGWLPAKLFTHLDNEVALNQEEQIKMMDELVKDRWWQTHISEYKILHSQTTFNWGTEYNLYRNSMNPIMSPEFMLKKHIPYKSTYIQNLYHAGSSTALGQGISLCAISGIHAANSLAKFLI